MDGLRRIWKSEAAGAGRCCAPRLENDTPFLKLHRKDTSGKVEVLSPSMEDRVRDGDVIYVRESLF